jgi:hypothetical protein
MSIILDLIGSVVIAGFAAYSERVLTMKILY